jgi:hypothetical protein
MNLLGTWLTDRMDLQLHLYQLKILIRVVKVRNSQLLVKTLCYGWDLFKEPVNPKHLFRFQTSTE